MDEDVVKVQSTETGAPRPDVLRTAHEARLLQAGRMLAGIVHEIRNPLAVIQGYAQLLHERIEDPEPRQDLESILQETHRLSALVGDMLSFVRRDASDAVESVDLARVVQAAVNLTTHAMRQSRVTLVANLPEENCFVSGQTGAYIQVLLNLLENARQSLENSPPSTRGIIIRVERGGQDSWVVRVSNNGPPIAPEHVEAVFESFFTTKREAQGTGLGLSLCREILTRFGGKIGLEEAGSTDTGVTFRLDLPNA
jgi:signal transduction histidine kinase